MVCHIKRFWHSCKHTFLLPLLPSLRRFRPPLPLPLLLLPLLLSAQLSVPDHLEARAFVACICLR
jgi:hypothetical protein